MGQYFFYQQKAGVGVILRDHKGEVLVAYSKVETEMTSPEFIEVIAMLKGLKFCAQQGVPKLILESDCLLLVNEPLSSFRNFFALKFLM